MTQARNVLLLTLAATIACACATAPTAPTAPPAASAPTAVATAGQPAAAGDDTVKLAKSLGYRPRQQGGKTVYCRTEAVTGSKLERETCVSADSLGTLLQQQIAAQDELARSQRTSNPSSK